VCIRSRGVGAQVGTNRQPDSHRDQAAKKHQDHHHQNRQHYHQEIATEITTPGTIAKLVGYGEKPEHAEAKAPAESPPKPPAEPPAKPPAESPLSIRSEKSEKLSNKGRESPAPVFASSDLEEAKRRWDLWWHEASGADADWTPKIEAALAEKIASHGLDEVQWRFDCAKNDPPKWPPERDIATVLRHFDKFARSRPKKRRVPQCYRPFADDPPPQLFKFPKHPLDEVLEPDTTASADAEYAEPETSADGE
jgi:hypothetical protein